MSQLSKQALQVENTTNFPNNTTGYITPTLLRGFNSDMIDSTVNQTGYTSDSGSWNTTISNLNAFTASQQPSFTALNAFTASQLVINSGVNVFTQSANSSITQLNVQSASFYAYTASINQIQSNGVLLGTSTRFNLVGPGTFFSASLVQNVNGPIATLTFTSDAAKVNTSSFNDYTQSVNVSIAAINANTGSYAVTGSNIFTGNQIVSGYVSASAGFYSGPNTTALNIGDGSNLRFWTGATGGTDYYNVQLVPGVGDIAFSRTGASNVKVMTLAGAAGNNTTFQNNPVVFNDTVSSLTVNAQSTAISGSGSYSLQASTISNSATTATTTASSSFIGTLGITGQSGNDGRAIMLGQSGSLVLTNSSVTPTYSSLAHLSSSQANSNTNLIFKTNTNAADTIISGSGNIFANPAAPTTGFKRYIGTNNIFTHPNSVPQISGSMGFSPTMNANIINNNSNAFTFRGPVSSSTSLINHNIIMGGTINLGTAAASNFEKAISGVNMSSNGLFGGTINMVANTNILSSSVNVSSNLSFGGVINLNNASSSISFNSNINNGTLAINNRFTPAVGSNAAVLAARANVNTMYGTGHVVNFDGTNVSTTQGKSFSYNIFAGTFLTASIGDGDRSTINATAVIGNGLIVTGSTLPATFAGAEVANGGQGSAFLGRFNSLTGTADQSAETVFAVGTGTSYTNRKTGFLIDSGSNTFVEGTLNVSGSLFYTGSVYGNVSTSTITSSTASIDLSVANYFTLTLAGTTRINVINPQPGVTATLVINTDTAASASFSNNVKQPSGSLYVASPSGNVDIISFTAVNSTTVYAFPAQSFV